MKMCMLPRQYLDGGRILLCFTRIANIYVGTPSYLCGSLTKTSAHENRSGVGTRSQAVFERRDVRILQYHM